ncbi:hypothetical protein D9619_001766 [Psilocybe cf. subviscida]|uniref:Tyrosine--tRNA ligase n=1 Tax=Psilocybe cf. subviscida TaxID=2480587 RepID=A0A8H5F2D2_9AGAR|nr:hypothetical protein D9619_001766 [Psilocybe cf. subviscida]
MLRRVLQQRSLVHLRRQYHRPAQLLRDLTDRGFIQDSTSPDVLQKYVDTPGRVLTAYAGVDPTAKALHIGHLIPLLALLHFRIRGHNIIPLIGGATGRVGDPSGRKIERELAKTEQVEENARSLTNSITQFFERGLAYANSRMETVQQAHSGIRITNNLEWHDGFSLLGFLQEVGSYARVNTMLNRESVQARLEAKQGLSFTEFTYQLLQAYDFHYLYKHHECSIQIGGSDQWGNIVAGLELIGKLNAQQGLSEAFGITTPLLTTASGEKFGKSAGNAIWLDSNMTSVFDFYQYFLKVADADVKKYLKLFTLMSSEEVEDLVAKHENEPEKRLAQYRLAAEVTEMVHLEDGVRCAVTKSKLLFDADYSNLKAQDVLLAFEDDPRMVQIPMEEALDVPIIKLSAKYSLVATNGAAKNLVASKGLYLNNVPVASPQSKVEASDLIDGRVAIIRAGKDKLLVLVAGHS